MRRVCLRTGPHAPNLPNSGDSLANIVARAATCAWSKGREKQDAAAEAAISIIFVKSGRLMQVSGGSSGNIGRRGGESSQLYHIFYGAEPPYAAPPPPPAPLRRTRDAQRRLLGGGEAAQVHLLATPLHLRLLGLGLAGLGEAHSEVARLVIGHA